MSSSTPSATAQSPQFRPPPPPTRTASSSSRKRGSPYCAANNSNPSPSGFSCSSNEGGAVEKKARTAAGSTPRTPLPNAAISSSPVPSSPCSPPKRQRIVPGVKLLPQLYQNTGATDLVILIADMLQELVGLNDRIPLSGAGLTRFHSRAPPSISITDYLHRLCIHASLQPSILLSMVYYIDILSTHYPPFVVSSLTVHRFLITAATVASKGLCDTFLTNSFYAKVGGLSLMELNMLELEFLVRVGWRIVPKAETLEEYYRSLVMRMGGKYRLEEDEGG